METLWYESQGVDEVVGGLASIVINGLLKTLADQGSCIVHGSSGDGAAWYGGASGAGGPVGSSGGGDGDVPEGARPLVQRVIGVSRGRGWVAGWVVWLWYGDRPVLPLT